MGDGGRWEGEPVPARCVCPLGTSRLRAEGENRDEVRVPLLTSMTGFGEALCQTDGLAVKAEVRTVNNRYLKVIVRCGEGYAALEPLAEAAVRRRIRRGTVQVAVQVTRARSADQCRIRAEVLDGYRRQYGQWARDAGIEEPLPVSALLLLPGVVDEGAPLFDASADWPLIETAIQEALDRLDAMRSEEGQAMQADLAANCRTAAESLDGIAERAPLVIEAYRARLQERLSRLLAEYEVSLEPADLIKEVALFAERSDISEEVIRLRSHVEQFTASMDDAEPAGRKLEFITQEMAREVNTIGSKASDVEIAREVIEIKAALERIREMVQNVE